MNPLLLLAGLGAAYYFLGRTTESAVGPTTANAKRAGEIPPGTSTTDSPASQYRVWTESDLTLKAAPSGKPVQIYSFNGRDVYLSEHTLTRTTGSPLDTYAGFVDADKFAHFRTFVDKGTIEAVANGTSASAPMWIAGSSGDGSEAAIIALFNHLKKYDSNLVMCSS